MVQRPLTSTVFSGLRLAATQSVAQILAALILLVACGAPSPAMAQKSPPSAIDLLDQLDQQIADLVEIAHKSVVSVRGQMRRIQPGAHPNQVFVEVTGTGYLIPGGIVVTTAEVVANISNPSVVFSDETTTRATAMALDARANVAVLRIKTNTPQAGLRWGDSAKVRAGNFAITIGNHSGFADSTALGLISNPHQKAMSSKGERHYDSLIQFQGAVGGGGIGSPLLNLHGEVIGMVIGTGMGPGAETSNARIRFFGSSNMGFALPANIIHDLLDSLVQNAKPLPEAGWFGFWVFPQPKNHPDNVEVTISEVANGSPAEHVGIQPGDVVIAVDDEPIRSNADLRRLADQLSAGQKVHLDLRRGDKPMSFELQITPKPDTWKKRPRVGAAPDEIEFCHPMG